MDTLSRIYCESLKLRAYTVTSLETVREITYLHKTTPNATVALGRVINGAALLSATLKPETNQSALLKISGSGPIKEIHVQADAYGNIRGYVANPMIDLTDDIGEISFSKVIEAGLLTIIKDIGMNEPYSSITPLLYGEVAADLAYYFTVSEQIPSAVIIGLNINREGIVISSGGILIQPFPDTDVSTLDMIEANIKNMTRQLGDRLHAGENIYSIVEELFGGSKIEILNTINISHRCRCSYETMLNLLGLLNREEIKDMIEKDHGASITCTFCTKEYNFSEDELLRLI
ncbi:MAG: Hsp33 family molecular chaperone HslO [Leptospirales bacterium]|nr:Hsp33 family molecular chaperone HslO [Leptospirales bacterium]